MFHENLKNIRKQKGFSQEQLAVRLNVVRQTVSKWETGNSVPDAELLIKLGEVLNVLVSDLLGKKIEIPDGKDELEVVALELSKLNELLVTYGQKISKLKKKIGLVVGIVIVLCVFYFGGDIVETIFEIGRTFGRAIGDALL